MPFSPAPRTNRCNCSESVTCCRTLNLKYSHPPQQACFEDRNDHLNDSSAPEPGLSSNLLGLVVAKSALCPPGRPGLKSKPVGAMTGPKFPGRVRFGTLTACHRDTPLCYLPRGTSSRATAPTIPLTAYTGVFTFGVTARSNPSPHRPATPSIEPRAPGRDTSLSCGP